MNPSGKNESDLIVSYPSDREICIERRMRAPRERIFDAWINPDHVPHWMLGPDGWSMPVCEIDPRVGGGWHMIWRKDDGAEMEMRGVYTEMVPPERLVSTESWGEPWPETVNTLVLTEQDGVTTIVLTILYPDPAARDAAMKTGMMDGMTVTYNRLEDYLNRESGS
jgi:uncharacterized protein YndB with AHSA1/START domain